MDASRHWSQAKKICMHLEPHKLACLLSHSACFTSLRMMFASRRQWAAFNIKQCFDLKTKQHWNARIAMARADTHTTAKTQNWVDSHNKSNDWRKLDANGWKMIIMFCDWKWLEIIDYRRNGFAICLVSLVSFAYVLISCLCLRLWFMEPFQLKRKQLIGGSVFL